MATIETKRITELPVAVSVSGTEVIPLVQDSVTKQTNLQTIANQMLVGPPGAQGDPGADGIPGPIGATGPIGPGVVAGGSAGQLLSKIDGTDYNTAWVDIDTVSVVAVAAVTLSRATHSGLRKYIRASGDLTFSSAENYVAGDVFNIRALGTIELLESSVVLTPPAGGTLELTEDMSVSVIMTSATAGDVIGQTVPA